MPSMKINRKKNIYAALLGLIFALLLLELFCQMYFFTVIVDGFKEMQESEAHYFKQSDDPVLTYELQPNFHFIKESKEININNQGIRDKENNISNHYKIAVLGDSVAFGINLSDEDTVSSILQQKFGSHAKVLNLGVPGYGLPEILRFLELKNSLYSVNHIIYILNLNDFTARNSMYEGGSNGLYRMYKHPTLKSPFFLRKAIYRFYKHGKMSSLSWYRWLFRGNKEKGLQIINRISAYAHQHNSKFTILVLPAGVAYQNETYQLEDISSEILSYLENHEIDYINPEKSFAKDTANLIDDTDHMTSEGSRKLGEIIWKRLDATIGFNN